VCSSLMSLRVGQISKKWLRSSVSSQHSSQSGVSVLLLNLAIVSLSIYVPVSNHAFTSAFVTSMLFLALLYRHGASFQKVGVVSLGSEKYVGKFRDYPIEWQMSQHTDYLEWNQLKP
jgi:hypothetical protein